MVKKISALLLTLLLLSTLAVTVLAHPVPDLTTNGSITFVMDYNGEPLNNGKLNLSKVGEIVEDDGSFVFAPVLEFADLELDYSDVTSLVLAQELLTLAKEMELEKIAAPIEAGQAVFADLMPGLYVVWQDKEDATEGFETIAPFLISCPRFETDKYVTNVVANPKVGFETVPPTTTPPPPNLPQTGQLNWPVPVLAISGAALFVVGFVLWTGRKRV